MSFYRDWLDVRGEATREYVFLQQFLDYSPESLETLTKGNKEDVAEAIKLLLSVPVSLFLDAIYHTYTFSSKDVFQFSKLEDATETLCNILVYEKDSLSYEEAGKFLIRSPHKYACIKYGENHAKTAAMLTLVVIEKTQNRKCNVARISPLGSVSTLLSSDEKRELLRRLAIRNPFMKTLIYNAKTGGASYLHTVSSVISGQTVLRRKHNNEIIMKLILEKERLKDRIRWQ